MVEKSFMTVEEVAAELKCRSQKAYHKLTIIILIFHRHGKICISFINPTQEDFLTSQYIA